MDLPSIYPVADQLHRIQSDIKDAIALKKRQLKNAKRCMRGAKDRVAFKQYQARVIALSEFVLQLEMLLEEPRP